MELIRAAFIVFCLSKIGQYFFEAPAGIPQLPPNVEVLRLSADIDQSINRTGSTENPATWGDDPAVVTSWLGLSLVTPIESPIVEQPAKAEWNVKPRMPVIWACLYEKHAMATGRSEAVGQNATRTAGPYDDIVKRF
jgi:hypothetical protein